MGEGLEAKEEEIERRFLVDIPKVMTLLHWETLDGDFTNIRQGYLVAGPVSVRLRMAEPFNAPAYGQMTVKGPGSLKRFEKNVDLPPEHTKVLLAACPKAIWKHRYDYGRWEIDRFLNVKDPETGALLWQAEIELVSEDESFERPDWLGREVTDDVRYTNARLSEQVIT